MSETTTKTKTLRCVVVTPEETVLDTTADFIALPLFDGELGVSLHHSPMIGRLGFGELRIRSGSETTRFYVEGGFVQIADNVVSVLTNNSLASEKVKEDEAKEKLDTLLGEKATGDEQLDIRDQVVGQARAQLRMARRSK